MDIYNDDDNVISSDEYDEADDLLNVAISASNPTIEPVKAHTRTKKPQEKTTRKLAIKLKKKSVKWMQLKFKRIEIRRRYLNSIARAKLMCINKPISVSAKGGAELSLALEPKKVADAEKSVPRKEENAAQHETIDLDDSDDDEDEDVDDYDDDDDSSSNSSNSSNEDIDDDMNDEYDEDINELNNDDDDDNAGGIKHEDDYVAELKNDVNGADTIKHDKINNLNEVKHLDHEEGRKQVEDDDIAKVTNDLEVKNIEIQPDRAAGDKNIADNMSDALMSSVEAPKQENKQAVEVEQAPISLMSPSVANSTLKEPKMSQKLLETMTTPTIATAPIIKPNIAKTFHSMETNTEPQCNINDYKTIVNRSVTTHNTTSQTDILDLSRDLGIEQSFFFNDELNALFPNFDKIVNDHVTFPQTAEIVKERIKQISADVVHINKALEIKERECNQLLYVKHTKEQILARLLHKIKRYEVNTDDDVVEAIAARELGLVPKQTRSKEPPAKRRKLELRTAQEIIEHGANMSMDQVLRAKVQSNLDANFLDDTLKKFGLSTPKISSAAKLKMNSSKLHNGQRDFSDTSVNFSRTAKRSYEQMQRQMHNHEQASTTQRTSQNLLLNLLNNDNDSEDDAAAISYNMQSTPHESTTVAHIFDTWADQHAQKMLRNFNGKAENDSYEVFVENKNQTTPANNVFPILNQSKKTPHDADETLVVQLDLNDFNDETPTQKVNSKNINNFICQYCGIHKAQYVCAECENQWYCSRSCQVKAWDSHSEVCE